MLKRELGLDLTPTIDGARDTGWRPGGERVEALSGDAVVAGPPAIGHLSAASDWDRRVGG